MSRNGSLRWLKRNDSRIQTVVEKLEEKYGEPEPPPQRDGLQVLVLTILSQNTTDPNALKAYLNLIKKFPSTKEHERDPNQLPRTEDGEIDAVKIRMSQAADALPPPDWEGVRTGDIQEIENCISVCGLQQSKAATIVRALNWMVEELESYDLDHALENSTPQEATKKLSSIKGIGAKTAAVTLIEAYRVDLCPVDTHVHRVAQRLKLVPESTSRNKTFRELQPIIPEQKGYSLHHNLLTFGRTVCTARNPDCEECFLRKICPYYRIEVKNEDLKIKFVEK